MKVVLCFGDSNTWGYDPSTEDRFGADVRWTGVLARELGAEYRVIEEGCNGRTTVWDDPIEGYKNGRDYLIPCLESQRPIDLVTIMLGTNDLKMRFSLSAYDIAAGAAVLVDIAQRSMAGRGGGAPRVLLMCPPPVATLTGFAEMFTGAEAKSGRLSMHYRQFAQELGCDFLDAGEYIRSSDIDGIHFEAAEHHKLGVAVAKAVKQLGI